MKGSLLAALALIALQDDLRKKLGDAELSGNWVYDDMNAGIAQAKETGRPMMVVFR
jgi:hypothetical protein